MLRFTILTNVLIFKRLNLLHINYVNTGLGLTVIQEFVEANGGTIEAHSVENKGTTLSFTVKAA